MVFGFFRAISGDLREAHFVRSPGLRLSSGPDDPYGGEAILGRRKELASGMMKDRLSVWERGSVKPAPPSESFLVIGHTLVVVTHLSHFEAHNPTTTGY